MYDWCALEGRRTIATQIAVCTVALGSAEIGECADADRHDCTSLRLVQWPVESPDQV